MKSSSLLIYPFAEAQFIPLLAYMGVDAFFDDAGEYYSYLNVLVSPTKDYDLNTYHLYEMTQEELAERTFIPKPTISNYENDRIDIKSSVIAELANALQTDPNYLILGEKATKADDGFMNEAAELFSKITDPKMQEMLLKQIRALV